MFKLLFGFGTYLLLFVKNIVKLITELSKVYFERLSLLKTNYKKSINCQWLGLSRIDVSIIQIHSSLESRRKKETFAPGLF